ncbi:hypothetical protein QCD79_31725, partial [Pseudomonas quasicaspiana]|nr:hypothetical protein [Pseudomonas quasicaspiana]
MPHHLAPRCRSVYPPADPEPWAAAMGHAWPIAAAHGSGSAGGYTERQRGAKWWGKSVLLTFAPQ